MTRTAIAALGVGIAACGDAASSGGISTSASWAEAGGERIIASPVVADRAADSGANDATRDAVGAVFADATVAYAECGAGDTLCVPICGYAYCILGDAACDRVGSCLLGLPR